MIRGNGVLRFILPLFIAPLLLLAAANIMDPYLVPVRSWAPWVITAAAAFGAWRSYRDDGLPQGGRRFFIALWCAVPVALAVAGGTFYFRKHAVLSATGPEVRTLGRHFITGYTRFDEVALLAGRGLIGGVYVTRRNARGKTAEGLRREIEYLQTIRRAHHLPPLIVATDQEGGIVSRLSPPLMTLPPLATLAGMTPERRRVAARHYGIFQGRELAAIGITVNFAPVLDLRPAGDGGLLDRNSHIGRRAIAADARTVADIGLAYARGLEDAGVTPVVKHFPGLGRITADTHHFRVSVDAPRSELEASDWLPFREVLRGTNAFLMVGHVKLSAIDPARPASHSRAVIHDLLRQGWGFQGITVTDDLLMSPVYQYGLCDAVIEALNAGIDLLLVAYDGQQFYRVMRCALVAHERGLLDEAQLAESARRLRVHPPPGKRRSASAARD